MNKISLETVMIVTRRNLSNTLICALKVVRTKNSRSLREIPARVSKQRHNFEPVS